MKKSFVDWNYVVFDDESKTVTIVLNDGRTREYKIHNQPELVDIILEGYENGDITIYDSTKNEETIPTEQEYTGYTGFDDWNDAQGNYGSWRNY